MQLSKPVRIIINYLFLPILISLLLFSIYHQISQQQHLKEAWYNIISSFTSKDWWIFWIVVSMLIVNYSLEAKKWQLLTSEIQTLTFWQSFKAVLSGQSLAFNTINNVGECVGRIAHLEEGKRLKAVSVSVVGSISQFIVTMIFGVGGLLYVRFFVYNQHHLTNGLNEFWLDGLIGVLFVGAVVLLFIYYGIAWIVTLLERIPFVHKLSFFIVNVEHFTKWKLTYVLLLSILRYCLFIIQYIMLMYLFKVNIEMTTIFWMVTVMFIILAIIPSISLAELGIRGELSKQLFGLFSTNTLGITFTAALIWLINKVLPALAGSLLLAGVRLFKNKQK